jgi:DNA-binding transcriptional LysR family regulator
MPTARIPPLDPPYHPRVRLSLAGREYLELVRTALRGLAEYPGHRRSRRRRKALRVGVPPAFAREVLVPCVGEFHASNPEVSLELLVAIPFQEVQDGHTDVDVRFGSGDYDDGEATLLLNEPMFPVCTPDYGQGMKLAAPQDLARAVLLRCPLDPWKPWFEAARLDWPEPDAGPRFNDAGIEAACPYSYFIVRRRKAEPAEAGVFAAWLGEVVGRDPARESAAAQVRKSLRAD